MGMKNAPLLCSLLVALTGVAPIPVTPYWLSGDFGGPHVALHVQDGSGTIQFDCAHAKFSDMTTSDANHARALGAFFREHGGPVRVGEVLPPDQAVFLFERRGGVVRLLITTEVKDAADIVIGTFTVKKNQPPQLFRCL